MVNPYRNDIHKKGSDKFPEDFRLEDLFEDVVSNFIGPGQTQNYYIRCSTGRSLTPQEMAIKKKRSTDSSERIRIS